MNNDIEFSKAKVSLECMEEATLPDYLGSTLRGVLGIELKRCICTKNLDSLCPNCEDKYSCAYTFFFNRIEQNADTKIMQTLPNSFIIEPISNTKLLFHKGDSLVFNIIFIGVNIGYIIWWRFNKFLQYIHIGSIVHIGKGCTFGLGKYTYEI